MVLTTYGVYTLCFGCNLYYSVKRVILSYFLTPKFRIMPLSWTLTFEMLLYIIFTISMLISIVNWDKVLITVSLITLFYFSSFFINPIYDHKSIVQNPIIYEFVLGMFVARLYFKGIILNRMVAWAVIPVYLFFVYWNVAYPMGYTNAYSWSHLLDGDLVRLC